MAFMDKAPQFGKKLGGSILSAAKSAASSARKTSEQVIEIGKLRKDILMEKGKINKLYEEIGKHAFDIYNSSKDFSLLEPLFIQISEGLSKIEDCNGAIEEIKAASDINEEDIESDDAVFESVDEEDKENED
jgi:hypothetical protein